MVPYGALISVRLPYLIVLQTNRYGLPMVIVSAASTLAASMWSEHSALCNRGVPLYAHAQGFSSPDQAVPRIKGIFGIKNWSPNPDINNINTTNTIAQLSNNDRT
jgi:hypothetical protein